MCVFVVSSVGLKGSETFLAKNNRSKRKLSHVLWCWRIIIQWHLEGLTQSAQDKTRKGYDHFLWTAAFPAASLPWYNLLTRYPLQQRANVSFLTESGLWNGSLPVSALLLTQKCEEWEFTSLCVVHPVEDDLGRSIPTRHDVAGHFCVSLPRQAKVENLKQKKSRTVTWRCVDVWDVIRDAIIVGKVRVPLAHSPG